MSYNVFHIFVKATKDTMENELPNGLVIGHAYSMTKVIYVSTTITKINSL